MATYPIRVPRQHYRGSNPRRREKMAEHNALAARLEAYINAQIEADAAEIQQFCYGYLAIDLREDEEAVRAVLFPVDCGHNGLTVRKGPP